MLTKVIMNSCLELTKNDKSTTYQWVFLSTLSIYFKIYLEVGNLYLVF